MPLIEARFYPDPSPAESSFGHGLRRQAFLGGHRPTDDDVCKVSALTTTKRRTSVQGTRELRQNVCPYEKGNFHAGRTVISRAPQSAVRFRLALQYRGFKSHRRKSNLSYTGD